MISLHSVVEGDAEVAAVPILLRSIGQLSGTLIDAPKPHRVSRSAGWEAWAKAVHYQTRLAAAEGGGAVVILDADDDAPNLLEKAIRSEVGHTLSEYCVAVPVREYEAWLLAGIESLRTHRAIQDTAACLDDPESHRNAKKYLEKQMTQSYKEVLHQPALTALLDIEAASQRAPSLANALDQILRLIDRLSTCENDTVMPSSPASPRPSRARR